MVNRAARRKLAKRRLAIMRSRPCGECQACCTRLSIESLAKPAMVPCQHLHRSRPGCGIYATRPIECRAFECAWRRGYGKPSDRPDLSGIMYLEAESDPAVMVAYDLARGTMEPVS